MLYIPKNAPSFLEDNVGTTSAEFGTVYEFSTPQTIDDKLKRTFIVNDNFTLPAVTKTVSVKRYEVKTWVHGPKEAKEDGGAQ